MSFLMPTAVRPAVGLCGTYVAVGSSNGEKALSGITQVIYIFINYIHDSVDLWIFTETIRLWILEFPSCRARAHTHTSLFWLGNDSRSPQEEVESDGKLGPPSLTCFHHDEQQKIIILYINSVFLYFTGADERFVFT